MAPELPTDVAVRTYQIGEVADRVGLSLRTIRHYEEIGLVPPSRRTSGGFRLYTDDDVELLELVRAMKPLEFSLEEMRELLDIRAALKDSTLPAGERKRMRQRLELFAASADERCQRLRDHLRRAESLAGAMRRDWGTKLPPAVTRDLR